jgi:hypothetical protein
MYKDKEGWHPGGGLSIGTKLWVLKKPEGNREELEGVFLGQVEQGE